jgi:hypothetical protein
MDRSREQGAPITYLLECECGWTGEGDEQLIVELGQAHGREVHKFAPTAEQVLAAARPRQ